MRILRRLRRLFSELNNKVQESVSGIKVTKSFGYQEQETHAFQEVNQATSFTKY